MGSPGADLRGLLSLAERNRRYKLIREKLAELGIDVLVLPANSARFEQNMADSRYVTGIGGYGTETLTVFPVDGEPTAFVFNRAGWWISAQTWITDVRDGANAWGDNVVERLTELGFRRGRIGLSGLSGLKRTPDGLVAHGTFERIRAAFADVEIVDATSVIRDIRAVKSLEEIVVMEGAAQVADAMADTVIQNARPGLSERQLHASVVHTMLAAGGELPSLLILGAGPDLEHGSFVPTDRPLRPGDLVVGELEGRVAGYGAQVVSPVVLGQPSAVFAECAKVAEYAFAEICDRLRPGVTLDEVTAGYSRALMSAGSRGYQTHFPFMHARGLGDEVPAVLHQRDAAGAASVPLAANMVFVLKPKVSIAGEAPGAQLGCTVRVTAKGGVPLGRGCPAVTVVE
jgi:Xaa-Pro dipeptidase